MFVINSVGHKKEYMANICYGSSDVEKV